MKRIISVLAAMAIMAAMVAASAMPAFAKSGNSNSCQDYSYPGYYDVTSCYQSVTTPSGNTNSHESNTNNDGYTSRYSSHQH